MITLPTHGPGWLDGKNPKKVYMDLETFSTTPITYGTHKYAEASEVMIWVYALENGPVQLWDLTYGTSMPIDLEAYLNDSDILTVWHNGLNFDKTVLLHAMGLDLPAERCWDTMAQALAHSLPGSLDKLCEILGLPQDLRKMKSGKALINLFCMPRKFKHSLRREDFETTAAYIHAVDAARKAWVGRATSKTHPKEWQEFCGYAKADIVSMREVMRRMPRWNMDSVERETLYLDSKINNRGVLIDLDLCHAAIRTTDREQARLANEVHERTNGLVRSATQRDALLQFILSEYDVLVEDLTKSTVSRLLDSPDLPAALKELLIIRQGATKTSTAKYKKFLEWVSSDDRLRGSLQFCGASRTGRFSARGVQPQNLPRPTMDGRPIEDDTTTDMLAEFIKLDSLDLVTDDLMEGCAATIRSAFIAAPGKKLVVADLSAIEARVLAWLAGEQWVLDAFREYDLGIGADQYKLTYANAFNISPELVTKSQRQTGKVLELACIAEDELVLTDCGPVPIQNVGAHMKVWDGVEFVNHGGVVLKGEKEVIEYDGLRATEDHLVWIKGEDRPVHFRFAASSGSYLVESGSSWGAIRVGGNYISGEEIYEGVEPVHGAGEMCKLPAHGVGVPVKFNAGKKQGVPKMLSAKKSPLLAGAKNGGHEKKVRGGRRPSVQKLRGEGDQVQFQIRGSSRNLDCGKLGAREKSDHRQDRQRWPLRTRESAVHPENRTIFQHEKNEMLSRRLGMGKDRKPLFYGENDALPARGAGEGPNSGAGKVGCYGKEEKLERNFVQSGKTRVYDLLNAGPRNRFTVSGKLVHNCGYQGGVGAILAMCATYRIDPNSIAEAVYQTLPEDILGESEGMWEWACEREEGREAKREKLRDKLSESIFDEEKKKLTKRLAKLGDATYGLDEKTFITLDGLKRLYRRARPNTEALWRNLEDAFRNALRSPGQEFIVGGPASPNQNVPRMSVIKQGDWTRIKLPSGRSLCYPFMKIQAEADEDDDGNSKNIVYLGINIVTKKWGWVKAYQGKFAEQCLAGNTQVITKNGIKDITSVLPEDKVWDGFEWVSTEGCVYKGSKEVGKWLGVVVTEDHLIHDGKQWKCVGSLDVGTAQNALKWGLNSVSSPWFGLALPKRGRQYAFASAVGVKKSEIGNYLKRSAYGVGNAYVKLSGVIAKNIQTLSVIKSLGICGSAGTRPSSIYATIKKAYSTATTVAEEYLCVANGYRIRENLLSTLKRCLDGTILNYKSIGLITTGTIGQETLECLHFQKTCETGAPASMLSMAEKPCTPFTLLKNTFLDCVSKIRYLVSLEKGAAQSHLWVPTGGKLPVYDLRNCGPRHSFTILSSEGPVVVHNCTQAVARDILVHGMKLSDSAGYETVLTVHDELITEAPDLPEYSVDELCQFMSAQPDWAKGLPLAAAGFESYRYRK